MGILGLFPFWEENQVLKKCQMCDFKSKVIGIDGNIFLHIYLRSPIDHKE